RSVDSSKANIMQATQAACMPTLDAVAQGHASCRRSAAQMQAYFADHKPDLVVMSADWLEYSRPPRFDGMIADIRKTIAQLNALGIRVVLLGPAVQFRSRLPSMLIRTRLRGADARADDFVLPDIFAFDRMMHAALPASDDFSYMSVGHGICRASPSPPPVRVRLRPAVGCGHS